jgi:hypothetical protein
MGRKKRTMVRFVEIFFGEEELAKRRWRLLKIPHLLAV